MISENKMKHILGVARRCAELANEKNLSPEMHDACFIMGFLHDIGYEYSLDVVNHPQDGYDMLNHALQYQDEILQAIKKHGRKYDNLSVFDEILNEADLTVNYKGEPVTIPERLKQIKHKHGENAEHYKHAVAQAEAIEHINERK